MTGEKNRGVSLEKLWKLDDETLTTPEHDKLVMLFFDEEFKRNLVSFIESDSENVKITGVSVKDFEYRAVNKTKDDVFIPSFAPNDQSSNYTFKQHEHKHCPYSGVIIDAVCPPIDNDGRYVIDTTKMSKEEITAAFVERTRYDENRKARQRLWEIYFTCHYINWRLKNETKLIQSRIDKIPSIKQWAEDTIKTTDPLDWYKLDVQSEVPIVTGYSNFIVGYWDIILTLTPKSRTKDHIIYMRSSEPKRFFIEVKPHIDSFGKVLRQLNTYREHQKIKNGDYIVLFTEDVAFQEAFENQGVVVIHPSDI
ncbi:MAG: hypothetical protein WC433_07605 [Candidatus Omnitrophota bacterium]|jgi:hypothetical protein